MNHLVEWEKSGVDDKLTSLNVTPLQGTLPLDYLLYSDDLPRRNDGRVRDRILKQYDHTSEGGWWCSGVDLLTGEADLWGCFKPEQPRLSADKGKPIKYEHPPKAPTGVFALRVPHYIWQQIGDRYGVDLPQNIDRDLPDLGFWQWLIEHPAIPLCITEGAKKAGALLTAGYAAVALPGINSGYRVPKDEQGNRISRSRLIPQLRKLAAREREICIAFDQDSKPSTVKAVEAAIKRLGYLFGQLGCSVKVITWRSELGKGVDDLIAEGGQQLFDEAYQKALPLDVWKAQALTRLTYTPEISLNCRYLPDLSVPDAKLVGIKSPKGTGKTRFLETIVSKALAKEQRVLIIGHRVRLVESLCQRFGLSYITEIQDNPRGATLGYGLCIDSMHPSSQACFNAENWSESVVIIDEVEQVLWHGLNSDTCKGNRVAILKSLKTLMQNVLGGDGQVFIADADLSNTSLDYLLSLAGVCLQPFIVCNDWKPKEESWQIYSYAESTPKRLVKDLEKHIRDGGKPFVCLSAQKLASQWGTCTLEAYLKKQFPDAKILRIDSESLAEPTHPACGCINNLNTVLSRYDIVLASPSIETGVSIELKGHFTSVWCIAQGIQPVNSVSQSLARIRENLPRYIWVAPYGFNKVGNGSTSIPALLTSGQRLTQLNIRLLQQSDFEAIDDLDAGFQAESLLCWAKMAVRVNASMSNYRQSILALLQGEGHQIVASLPAPTPSLPNADSSAELQTSEGHNQLSAAIAAVREQNYQAQCEAIALADILNDTQYKTLKKQLVKTVQERQSLRKTELGQRYGVTVTAELVAKDDSGWYQKLRIHYFLTLGRHFLAERDAIVAKMLIDKGGGSFFLPDFNGSQLGAKIGTLEVLGISVLLQNPERELKNTDPDLKAMAALALTHRTEIKAALGIGIAKNASPITILRRFLDLIDYGLECLRCEGTRKKRVRVYQIVCPNDDREQVLRQWLAADSQQPGGSEFWQDEGAYARMQAETGDYTNCVQLSLEF